MSLISLISLVSENVTSEKVRSHYEPLPLLHHSETITRADLTRPQKYHSAMSDNNHYDCTLSIGFSVISDIFH